MEMSFLEAAREAYKHLAGINAMVVGTFGLQLHGAGVEASDVDFLCEKMPDYGTETTEVEGYARTDNEPSRVAVIYGVTVNFILAGDARAPFLDPEPQTRHGLPVAGVEYILRLKLRADREKDYYFFREHPELAAIVGWGNKAIPDAADLFG